MDTRVHVGGCCFGIPFGCASFLLLIGSLIAWSVGDLGWGSLSWLPF